MSNNTTNTEESLRVPLIPDGESHEPDEENENQPDYRALPQQNDTFCIRQEISEMLALGFPLAVSFFCRMGMASMDSAFVGHIRDDQNSTERYLAAAVLSNMISKICITPALAFNRVLNALVGQAIGSGNSEMAGIWLQQSMFWLTITMIPCLASLFFVDPILKALGFSPEISALAGTYAKYNVFWPVPNGLYQCMRFYFQACGMPRPAMYNNVAFLFVNGLLNWFFIFGGPFPGWKGMGFIGAAVSHSISRTLQGLCYYLYMFVYKQHHKRAWPSDGWSFKHHNAQRTKEFMKQSLPNLGTTLFQSCASQAQTIFLGRLGDVAIAASSVMSTVTLPWASTLAATCCAVSGVRVGYHLGKGDSNAAQKSSWLVMYFITAVHILFAAVFLIPISRNYIFSISTSDDDVLNLAKKLVPAMLVGKYLDSLVNNGTSGIFSGQGRPLIATILSFGIELPLSIGGIAIYMLCFHGNLIGVYWWGAIASGIEIAIVLSVIFTSDWVKCASEARERQEGMTRDDSNARNEATSNTDVEEPPDPTHVDERALLS